MKKKLLLLMVAFVAAAAFATTMALNVAKAESTNEVTDVLTRESLGLPSSGTSYGDFANATVVSDAVYAGNAATNGGKCIQLRTTNSKEGIVTTASGGTVKSIKIEWNETTAAARTVDIYGNTTAYSTAADLYNTDTQGTKIASFVKSDGDKTIEINGDYQFIGIRSNSSALYIDKITIVWETEAPAVAKPAFSIQGGTYVGAQNVEITCATEGAAVYYTTDGTEPTAESTPYTAAVAINNNTTLKAIAIKDADQSAVATAEYKILESIANTEATAYTVTKAVELITTKDADVLAHADNKVYVKGTIKKIEEVSTQYGNATYTITDGTSDLTVYRGYYLNGEKFTSEDQLAIGKVVVVKGNLVNYQSTTPEVASGNQLVRIKNAPVDIEISPANGEDIATVLKNKIEELDIDAAKNITINLAEGASYTISSSIVAPASLAINGNGATIDASGLTSAMVTTPAGDLEDWAVIDFLVKDVTVKGLAKAFYASAGKNYLYNSFKVDNSVVELTANITYFDFTKGGVANLTINNSTLYGAVEHTKALYSSQSAQRPTDYNADATQTFTITNSTLYNIAKGTNFFTHRQNGQKWLTYVLKNDIFVNIGKSGQVAQGLNGGGQSANPTWDINGNVFNFDGADTSAKENPANDGGESVKNSIAGVVTFADTEAGDFNAEMAVPVVPEGGKIVAGDPRWTVNATQAPVDVVVEDADITDGNISTAVNAAVANVPLLGNININLAAEKVYTMTGSIVAPNSITINGNGATIDASGLTGAMVTTPAGDLEEWMTGDFLIKDVTIKGLAKALYSSAGKKYLYNSFKVENSVVELTANITYFDFTKGGVANLTINNSTLYGAVEHTKTLYSSQGGQKADEYNADATQTFTISNSTLYNIAKGTNFFTHRNNNQKWETYVLKNSIFVNVGKGGQVVKGINGGGSSTNPVYDIDGNAFNFDGEDTSASETTGNDDVYPVKNSVAGTIEFTDAIAGDFGGTFTLAEGATEPETLGDPRWTITFKTATGIESIKVNNADGEVWYNLNGMRIEKPANGGIYIHNGKKVVIK